MAKKEQNQQMTLDEYKSTYSKKEYGNGAKAFFVLLISCIGVLLVFCFASLCFKAYEINKYVGYGAIGLSVILYIFLFIVPTVKIKKTNFFITNVSSLNAKEAKKHNFKTRNEIADKMIEITAKTKGLGWYDEVTIGKLAIARQTKNNKQVKKLLSDLYDNSIKNSANEIIKNHAIQVGVTTAISQSEKLDTLFVVTLELKLIKDLVFLYGYRPSEPQLLRIYSSVLNNALVAYGAQSLTDNIATGVASKISETLSGLPILGSAISAIVGSASQGVINASLTVVIGEQTKKYLRHEYKAQDILDSIDVKADDKEEKLLLEQVRKEVGKKEKKIKALETKEAI